MVYPLAQIQRASRKYRRRFGHIHGLLLWYRLRQHLRRRRGSLHEVVIPGLKDPFYLRSQTSDVLVFIQIFVEAELEFKMRQVPKTIVDAGANIGAASVYFAHRYPQAQIIAVEVDESNFELLLKNTKPYPNITCIRKALWSGRQRLKLLNPDDEPWAFRVGAVDSNALSSVEALGVLDLVNQTESHRIDLLKIDIEGAEKEVFSRDAGAWIDHVQTIAVELHDHIEPGCTSAFTHVLEQRVHTRSQSGEYQIAHLAGDGSLKINCGA